MSKIKYSDFNIEDTTLQGDEHLSNMSGSFSDANIDHNYNYFPQNFLVQFLYDIILVIVKIFISLWAFCFHCIKIEGYKNIKKVKKTGCISISNHVNCVDALMIGSIPFGNRRIYVPTLNNNMQIPIVRHVLKAIGAMPLPTNTISAQKNFISAINTALQDNKVVHIMPEGSLWSYYNKLRPFKNGAFHFAIQNDVPILPMVYTFRKAKGLHRLLGRKLLITLTVLPPIYPYMFDGDGNKEVTELMKNFCHSIMSNTIEEHNSVNGFDLKAAYDNYMERGQSD